MNSIVNSNYYYMSSMNLNTVSNTMRNPVVSESKDILHNNDRVVKLLNEYTLEMLNDFIIKNYV